MCWRSNRVHLPEARGREAASRCRQGIVPFLRRDFFWLPLYLLGAGLYFALLRMFSSLPSRLAETSKDIAIYCRAGEAILAGEVPYRDFCIEYPPGSLPSFVPPAFFSGSRETYASLFASEMALALVAALVLTAYAARSLGANALPPLRQGAGGRDHAEDRGRARRPIVRRLLPGYHPALVFLLLPLLLPILGFAPGAQTSEHEVRRVAQSVPEVERILSHPTVETSARYDAPGDSWEVILREETSGTVVAVLTIEDETQEVSETEVYPIAETLAYPTTSEEDAIKLALADREVQDELTRHGPYTSYAEYEDGEWTVYLEVEEGGVVGGMPVEGGERKEIARVEVDDETWQLNYVWTGDQVAWRMARGDYGAYGKQANYPYVWGPLALLFALAFWRTDKLYSLRNLDVLALLSFLVSHGFFRVGETYPAVLLWYPPLLYLLARTLLMSFGRGERVEKTSNFPTAALLVLGVLASGLVLGLNLDSRVIDVGYAGVVGADRILDGVLPYGNMPEEVGTGDTYGPLNYLLYVPFLWFFGWSGEWDFLPAAHAVTALAFIVGAISMLVAGRRYAGAQGGAAMLFAWAVFPYTLYSANNNTNDIIVAAVAAVAIATATSPLARGASVVAGFAVKLFPIILAPLWMLHDGAKRRGSLLDFVLGGMGVFLLTFWVLALDGDPIGGVVEFFDRTLRFQGERETPWTIFAQVPALKVLQQVLTAAVVLLAFIVPVVLKKRTIRRLAALSAAFVIAFELTVNYWFYPYVTWFEPFVFVALLLATSEKTALDRECEEPPSSSGQHKPGREAAYHEPSKPSQTE